MTDGRRSNRNVIERKLYLGEKRRRGSADSREGKEEIY